jgi:transglutaminase-like putative cysteine protease
VIIDVAHETRYEYDRPVYLEPHAIRLVPRFDGYLETIHRELRVTPEPMGLSETLDPEGNRVAIAWFDGVTDRLAVTTRIRVRTLRQNPFDFLLTGPSTEPLPMTYSAAESLPLAPYARPGNPDRAVAEWAAGIAREAGAYPLPFVTALAQQICRICKVEIREEGHPLPARETLSEKTGSCRDLAVLFVDACRAQGIAGRFVSGYQCLEAPGEKQYLHAWGEVYLPGSGWRGFDPTTGLAVADRHIALAASFSPAGATPIEGAFRGDGAHSKMSVELSVRGSR